MVKLCCDRCGKEIKDIYYAINIYGYNANSNPIYTTADCAISSYSNTKEDMLRTLNSTKMYCKDCKDKIERFIGADECHKCGVELDKSCETCGYRMRDQYICRHNRHPGGYIQKYTVCPDYVEK